MLLLLLLLGWRGLERGGERRNGRLLGVGLKGMMGDIVGGNIGGRIVVVDR